MTVGFVDTFPFVLLCITSSVPTSQFSTAMIQGNDTEELTNQFNRLKCTISNLEDSEKQGNVHISTKI